MSIAIEPNRPRSSEQFPPTGPSAHPTQASVYTAAITSAPPEDLTYAPGNRRANANAAQIREGHGHGAQLRERDRQILMASFFRQIGRREIHRDALIGHL